MYIFYCYYYGTLRFTFPPASSNDIPQEFIIDAYTKSGIYVIRYFRNYIFTIYLYGNIIGDYGTAVQEMIEASTLKLPEAVKEPISIDHVYE